MAIASVSVLEFDSADALAFAQESHIKHRARSFYSHADVFIYKNKPNLFLEYH